MLRRILRIREPLLSLEEAQQDFMKFMTQKFIDMQADIEKKATISLDSLLKSHFSPIVDAHKATTKLLNDEEALLKVEQYQTIFISEYFKKIIEKFIQIQKIKNNVKDLFKEENWEVLHEKLKAYREKKMLEKMLLELFLEKEKIKDSIFQAEIVHGCDLGKLKLELSKQEEISLFGLKIEIEKCILIEIQKYKNGEYEKIILQEFSEEIAKSKMQEYEEFFDQELFELEKNSITILKVGDSKNSVCQRLVDEQIESTRVRLNAHTKKMQAEIDELKKTYPNLSMIIRKEFKTQLSDIKDFKEENAAKDIKEESTLKEEKELKPFKKKRKKIKLQKKHMEVEELKISSKDVSTTTENDTIKELKEIIHEEKIQNKEYKIPKEVIDLQSNIKNFCTDLLNKRAHLKDQITHQKDPPNFSTFFKDDMFSDFKNTYEARTIEKNAIEMPSTLANFLEVKDKNNAFPTPGYSVFSKMKSLPDFEKIKNTFVEPFFEGYAQWLKESIKNLTDIFSHKEKIQNLFEEKTSWEEIQKNSKKAHDEICKTMEEDYTALKKQHELFIKSLTETQKKYSFELKFDESFPDIDLIKLKFENFFEEKIAKFIENAYSNRFKKCLENFHSEFLNLKKELKNDSLDEICDLEMNGWNSKVEPLINKFNQNLKEENEIILKEIEDLQKAYPRLIIKIPHPTDIDSDLLKNQWNAYLNDQWRAAIKNDMFQLSEFKLTPECESEISAVEALPLEKIKEREEAAKKLKAKWSPDPEEYFKRLELQFEKFKRKDKLLTEVDEIIYHPDNEKHWVDLEKSFIAKRIDKISNARLLSWDAIDKEYAKKIEKQMEKKSAQIVGYAEYLKEVAKFDEEFVQVFTESKNCKELRERIETDIQSKDKIRCNPPTVAQELYNEKLKNSPIKIPDTKIDDEFFKGLNDYSLPNLYEEAMKRARRYEELELKKAEERFSLSIKRVTGIQRPKLSVTKAPERQLISVPEISKPEKPVMNVYILGMLLCTVAGAFLYLAYCLHQHYQYKKQLEKYMHYQFWRTQLKEPLDRERTRVSDEKKPEDNFLEKNHPPSDVFRSNVNSGFWNQKNNPTVTSEGNQIEMPTLSGRIPVK